MTDPSPGPQPDELTEPPPRSRKLAFVLPALLVVGVIVATIYLDPPKDSGAGGGSPTPTPTPTAALSAPAELPTAAVDEPASVSSTKTVKKALGKKATKQIVNDSAGAGIPAPALAAYQRAESVMLSAESACELDWTLLAAIGRVESDHGRFGGNVFDAQGVAQPGIYGPRLDGTAGTRAITDTDGGQYDQDTEYDRAVGPMQFIPSTWALVGVDGDNDGVRNPQDIDDAALGSAVYLCSGAPLSSDEGRRAAVLRYNHSEAYADLVLAIREAYLNGDFSSSIGTAVIHPPTALPTSPPIPMPAPTPAKTSKPGKTKAPGKGSGKGTATPAPLPTVPASVGPVLTWLEAQQQCIREGQTLDNPDALKACIEAKLG